MSAARLAGLSVLLCLFSLAPVRAAPPAGEEAPGKRASTLFHSDRFALSVKGPAGWTLEYDEPRSSKNWIDLVAYREEKTKAFLKISCQASTYSSFDELRQKLSAYYRGLSGLTLLRGPEVQPAVMGVRSEGLYVEYARSTGKRTDRSFLAYYLNGRFTVRLYGVVAESDYQKIGPAFSSFLASLRLVSRSTGGSNPNFVHEASRCALVFPEGWEVHLPAEGAVAMFVGERVGASIWLYREPWTESLAAFRDRRVENLERGDAKEIVAPPPSAHEKRGEPVLIIEYEQGSGKRQMQYREVCVAHGGAVYRLALGAAPVAFPRGMPALETMVESLRFK